MYGRRVVRIAWCLLAACVAVTVPQLAGAGTSWLSKVRTIPRAGDAGGRATASTAVFDVVISLHNAPAGDDDPDHDLPNEEQAAYESIVRHWADAVCEQSNGVHRLGKVRIFRNGVHSGRADVVWNASEHPRANVSGFGQNGLHITFGDEFPDGCNAGCDLNMLGDPVGAGYTLGHEWGHYVYGLYDEYVGNDPNADLTVPRAGDVAVDQAIMSSQWQAVGGAFRWLNHSTANNFQAKTAQGRVYGKSGWDVLVQDPTEDPRDGALSTLPERTQYTTLAGGQPTASDGWFLIDLPSAACRAELEIIWMQDDLEMQVVVDRSGSMAGAPVANAKEAAKNLVEAVPDGKTVFGVVSFADTPVQNSALTAIPTPGAAVKTAIKAVINGLTAGGTTAMFDAAGLALTNLEAYRTAQSTSAARIVFLLTDGMDNASGQTQGQVTAAYQAADVPLITFGYGSFAPTGVLQEMARDTGGVFFASPTSLADIQRAFLAAISAVSTTKSVVSASSLAPGTGTPGVTTFAVDATLESLVVLVSFPGAPGDVSLGLRGPAGTLLATPFACTVVGAESSCVANVGAATVSAAGAGTWRLDVTSLTGAAIPLNVDVLAQPRVGRTYELSVAPVGGAQIVYPRPLLITAATSKGLPITGLQVVATVIDPTGGVSTIVMNDAGTDGDGKAGDGIYSAIVDYTMNGIHRIEVTASNAFLAGSFTTEGSQPSPTTSGQVPPTRLLPPITEDFLRTSIIQVSVVGLTSDDHSDVAPGTPMLADNVDVDGRIDRPGDVDVFRIQGIDTTKALSVRVTRLALGMAPLLTIYEPDGVTVVASVDQASVGAGQYLMATVPSSQLDPTGIMIASVQHRVPGAALGWYAISAGRAIGSDSAVPHRKTWVEVLVELQNTVLGGPGQLTPQLVKTILSGFLDEAVRRGVEADTLARMGLDDEAHAAHESARAALRAYQRALQDAGLEARPELEPLLRR